MTFHKPVIFLKASFKGKVDLAGSRFEKEVSFDEAECEENVMLSGTTFYSESSFYMTTFHKLVSLQGARIIDVFNFEKVNQRKKQSFPDYILDFRDVTLGRSAIVRIATCNLKKAVFLRTDVTNAYFYEVVWKDKTSLLGKAFGKRILLYDETLHYDKKEREKFDTLQEHNSKYNPERIFLEYLYRQLKLNYDRTTHYAAGGEFHISEMEMKHWRESPRFLFKIVFWLFSPTAWYRRISMYGESYWLALVWFLVGLFLFSVLFMFSGLSPSSNAPEGYHKFDYVEEAIQHYRIPPNPHKFDDWTSSVIYTLRIFSFQREALFVPQYKWGHFWAVLARAYSPAMLALFLLALRRRFKR